MYEIRYKGVTFSCLTAAAAVALADAISTPATAQAQVQTQAEVGPRVPVIPKRGGNHKMNPAKTLVFPPSIKRFVPHLINAGSAGLTYDEMVDCGAIDSTKALAPIGMWLTKASTALGRTLVEITGDKNHRTWFAKPALAKLHQRMLVAQDDPIPSADPNPTI